MSETVAGLYAEADHVTVRRHDTPDDCWVILYGKVVNVTAFLPDHPGGSAIILKLAGTDATDRYDPIHPKNTLEESLSEDAFLGTIDASTLPKSDIASDASAGEQKYVPAPVSDCLNMDEIEQLATQKMSKQAWAYYFSAADDHLSKELNNVAYRQILLRPRIFVDTTKVDTSTTLLGNNVNIPFFVSPAAQARLGHPAGEHGIAQACATYGACQIISNNASQSPEDIVAGASADQVFGWQLYVQVDRSKSEKMLARVNKLKQIRFVVLTLDAPIPGKREIDQREGVNFSATLPVTSSVSQGSDSSRTGSSPTAASAGKPKISGGVGQAQFAGTACDLTPQNTLPWLAKQTSLPIVLKGVQTHEDAYMASQHPQIKAIILSNHGGRAADTAPPSIHTLLEIRRHCPSVFDKIEVWVDGGIKRGTDIVKALALGARGVGIGRLPLYGLAAGGVEGVERVLEILKAEVETAMRLLGVETVDQLGPNHINARALERDIYEEAGNLDKLQAWLKAKL